MILTFWVPGEPRAKQSFRYAGRGSFTPARIKAWQADVGWAAQQAMRAHGLYDPIEGSVVVILHFHLGNRRRIDLDNLSKGTLDGLNKIVWADDQQIQRLTITKQCDKANPGVRIIVHDKIEVA